jgi:hypothetical protein
MIIFDFELKDMEDFIKFVFYAIIFVIYVVSQIRKAKNKKEAEESHRSELDPNPVVIKQRSKQSESQATKHSSNNERPAFESKRVMKPLLRVKAKEVPKVQVEYKTLDVSETEEDLRFKKVIEDRKIKEGTIVKSKIGQTHEDPYAVKKTEKPHLTHWLQSKSSIKQAFVASEIFKRKY